MLPLLSVLPPWNAVSYRLQRKFVEVVVLLMLVGSQERPPATHPTTTTADDVAVGSVAMMFEELGVESRVELLAAATNRMRRLAAHRNEQFRD